MWAWLLKLLSGFNLTQPDKVGKFIYHAVVTLIVIAFLVAVVWKIVQRTERTNIVNPGVVNIQKECPKEPAVVLMKLWRLRLLSVQ